MHSCYDLSERLDHEFVLNRENSGSQTIDRVAGLDRDSALRDNGPFVIRRTRQMYRHAGFRFAGREYRLVDL